MNSSKIFTPLGASNHTRQEREKYDFYATSPEAVRKLFDANTDFTLPEVIYEPACGTGCLSEIMKREYGKKVYSYDIVDRGYGDGIKDFLQTRELPKDCNCILTNPPYSLATEFIVHSMRLLQDEGLCVMFLKTTFLEGLNRYKKIFSVTPPIFIFQFISRILCAKNADFERMKNGGGSAVAYAWFIFKKGYKGNTTVKWI